MQILRKLANVFKGFYLMLVCVKLFPTAMLKGMRIAIVGPAASSFRESHGDYIDSFDLVARINKAPLLLIEGSLKNSVGTKADILFHSFFENDFSGGGELDFELFDQLGIRFVVNPMPTFLGWRISFNFYKKYLNPRKIYRLPYSKYRKTGRRFAPYRPTTGFCALKCLIEANFSELYITGFTFFRTGYVSGYRDQMKTADQARAHIDKMNLHNPDLELAEFKRLLRQNGQKRILLDETLKEIVNEDQAQL